ncbi:hypothetical protein EDD85DRAFT_974855 [Armillaria nabsnona]|nr:hypothetical protein EDD85DRAFT_974855 [Armillaria nabsnona]
MHPFTEIATGTGPVEVHGAEAEVKRRVPQHQHLQVSRTNTRVFSSPICAHAVTTYAELDIKKDVVQYTQTMLWDGNLYRNSNQDPRRHAQEMVSLTCVPSLNEMKILQQFPWPQQQRPKLDAPNLSAAQTTMTEPVDGNSERGNNIPSNNTQAMSTYPPRSPRHSTRGKRNLNPTLPWSPIIITTAGIKCNPLHLYDNSTTAYDRIKKCRGTDVFACTFIIQAFWSELYTAPSRVMRDSGSSGVRKL